MTMPAGADVNATVREMWTTRPVRDAEDRKIAGVAAALARRYAIDPTLVRVGFVVAGVYGVGVLLYLAGWLALPARPGAKRPGWLVVVAAVVVGAATFAGTVGGGPRAVVGLAVVAGLLFALHRSRAALGVPGAGAAPAPAADGDPATTEAVEADGPPRWDPLGAAPFAWDLPEPGESSAPPAPRSRIVAVTLAAALVAAGAATVLGLTGLVPLGVTPVVGTALAVVGIGLVVGAFAHTGRGLVVAAVPLALVLLVAAGASGPWSGDDGPWGPPWVDGGADGSASSAADGSWTPAAVGMVAPSYSTGVGDAHLDLRSLPPGPPVSTSVESGVGDVRVEVPLTADVTIDCATGVGEVDCLGRTGAGQSIDLGPDGPGGQAISLRARSGAGDVEVTRG